MNDEGVDFFVGLETAVWEALVAGDESADRALLAGDFLGVYPSGFAERSDHCGQLDQGPSVREFAILSPTVVDLCEGVVLLAYEARFRRPGVSAYERMFVSSIWSKRADGWVNVFSQDTPANRSVRRSAC